LCFDTTSLAHRDAVRGERHPPISSLTEPAAKADGDLNDAQYLVD